MTKIKMDRATRDDARLWQRHLGVTWTEAIEIARSPHRKEIGAQVDAWIASGEASKMPLVELRNRVIKMLGTGTWLNGTWLPP